MRRECASSKEIPIYDTINIDTRFTIQHKLGSGGMGQVYLAVDSETGKDVAIKVAKVNNQTAKRRFSREIEILSGVHHESIVGYISSGFTDDTYWYAMDYIPGPNVTEWFKSQGILDYSFLATTMGCIASALSVVHNQGVVHRDVKPSNIIINTNGDAKLLDFGMVKPLDDLESPELSVDGSITGSPLFMSPEQALGEREPDVRSDVYSLGAILYEMLTGKPPYEIGRVTRQSVRLICELLPPRPSSIRPELRGGLDAIILKSLEKRPGDRYQTVGDLTADIGRYLDHDPIQARSAGIFYVLRKNLYRRRWRFAGSLLAVALIAMGVVSQMGQPYDTTRAQSRALFLKCEILSHPNDPRIYESVGVFSHRYADLPETILIRAHSIYSSQEPRVAIMLLENALDRDPARWDCRLLLDNILRAQGMGLQTGSGVPAATVPPTFEGDIRAVFAALDPEVALERAREALRRRPDDPLALEAAARLSTLTGDLAGSLEFVNERIASDGDASDWLRFKGIVLLRLGRIHDALLNFNEFVTSKPENAVPYTLRGNTLRRLGRYAEAIEDFDRSIDLLGSGRRAAWIYYHRATAHWIMGNREQAVDDYATASRLLTHPNMGDARRFLILREMGRVDEAQKVLRSARSDVEENEWLSKVLECLEGHLTPADLVDFAGAAPARRCEGLYYAAEVCLLKGDRNAAREWFRRCVDLGVSSDPEEPGDPMSEHELAVWRLAMLDTMDE